MRCGHGQTDTKLLFVFIYIYIYTEKKRNSCVPGAMVVVVCADGGGTYVHMLCIYVYIYDI